jgi:hypothetical protein
MGAQAIQVVEVRREHAISAARSRGHYDGVNGSGVLHGADCLARGFRQIFEQRLNDAGV